LQHSPSSPHFFKDIRISALALLKMVMHARSGGTLEVMGLLVGKVDGNTMVVMDSFALPVEGTETRVNAQAQAYEYMTQYMESAKKVHIICGFILHDSSFFIFRTRCLQLNNSVFCKLYMALIFYNVIFAFGNPNFLRRVQQRAKVFPSNASF